MRFDLVSIFPQYFDALQLSLLGKAQARDLMEIHIHDLREWTQDRHRTVDDTPYGGGAGMVMKPDVWGRSIDQIISEASASGEASASDSGPVTLAIPTPSGRVFDQALAAELAERGGQLIVACGRYEGIDYRVAEYYRQQPGVEVLEYSIGDYVLNGGEVAALALVEAVGRLLEGVVGNPESLVEESHTDLPLLEYPAYTKPPVWNGLEVPQVLLGGNHGDIEAWRRSKRLERTLERRPELLQKLDPEALEITELEQLANGGVVYLDGKPKVFRMRQPGPEDLDNLVELIHSTFPLACPEYLTEAAIKTHLETELKREVIAAQLAKPKEYLYVVGEVDGKLVGYTMAQVIPADGYPPDPDMVKKCPPGTAYLSKCYVKQKWHGSGIAGALTEAAIAAIREASPQAPGIALGTNTGNKRARKFYRRHGFKVIGRRIFDVGGIPNYDVIMMRNFPQN